MTGNVRQGDGEYTNGEKGIQGVNVKFTENSGTGKEYTAITNQDGDFSIAGFIPGDYTVTYIWGDTIYTVQKYKGTIYDSSRDQTNTKWYKDNVDKRLTDALDNYETRQKIDDELKEITNSTQITIDKMDSITPKMDIGVEYETTATSSEEDKYVYSIKNVDFGIVERARQSLAMTKRINSMKVTLANGQVVSNITIDENGNIVGDNKYLTYMKPSQAAEPRNGFLKLELDNELIEGAKLEVTYEIKAINNSELDYTSENFYKYGDSEGGTVVTISPSAIIDYLDNDWAFDSSSNTGWEVKTLEQIKDSLAEVVYNNENSTINEKTILYTEKLKDQKLAPIESASVMLNVSKLLSNSDEISLDNETEVIKVTKDGGSELTSIPGNYVPGIQNNEPDGDESETVIVTPSTGENQNYVLPITIGVSILAIFGLGITLIKKLVLKNK